MMAIALIIGFKNDSYDLTFHAYQHKEGRIFKETFIPENRNQPIIVSLDKKHKVKLLKFLNNKLKVYVGEHYPGGFMVPNLQENFNNIREVMYSNFGEYLREFMMGNAELFI